MPTVRKLTIEETRAIEDKGKTKRRLIEEEYDAFLASFFDGDYGEAEPAEGESRPLVRKRLKEAAARRGASLEFLRSSGGTLRFKVSDTEVTDEEEGLRLVPAFGTRSATSLEELEDIPF